MDIPPPNRGILSPESLAGFSPAATPTPSTTTESYDTKGDDWQSVRPGRSQIFSKYFSDGINDAQGWAILDLRMVPNPGARSYKEVPWAALLDVRTPDMPRLMRKGFFWSPENILPEEGYISGEARPEWAGLGFIHKRTWILADKSNDEVPRWVGRLDVFAPSLDILPSFQVQHLTRKNVYYALAWNGLNQLIYHYDYCCAQKSFNCIYDDKPLSGWWPWPRAQGMSTASTTPRLDWVGEPSTHFSITGSQPCSSPDIFSEPLERQKAGELNQPQHPDQLSTSCVIL
jgi:hypothetical protein